MSLRSRAHEARAEFTDRVDAMLEQSATQRLGTRRRAAAFAAVGLLALGSLYQLVARGVLAAGFTAENSRYTVYTAEIKGQYAAGYIDGQPLQNGSKAAVAQLGFKSANLAGLCLIVQQAGMSMVLSAGQSINAAPTGTGLINADYIYISSDALSGTGQNISGLVLGQSIDSLFPDYHFPVDTAPTAGTFGLGAVLMDIQNLTAMTYNIYLEGAINLPKLAIHVVPGSATKSNCP